jgi:hypothetical protein
MKPIKSVNELKSEFIRVRATPAFVNKLRKLAAKENRTVSNLIENVLSSYLKKH